MLSMVSSGIWLLPVSYSSSIHNTQRWSPRLGIGLVYQWSWYPSQFKSHIKKSVLCLWIPRLRLLYLFSSFFFFWMNCSKNVVIFIYPTWTKPKHVVVTSLCSITVHSTITNAESCFNFTLQFKLCVSMFCLPIVAFWNFAVFILEQFNTTSPNRGYIDHKLIV